ncbi:hypothetical protein B0H14DRAFT_3142823 [Mycena olivaceomarginata]|nr:hypothetical protein B0H14DRAFT_3142823 [Mycena olivaceomarginata]
MGKLQLTCGTCAERGKFRTSYFSQVTFYGLHLPPASPSRRGASLLTCLTSGCEELIPQTRISFSLLTHIFHILILPGFPPILSTWHPPSGPILCSHVIGYDYWCTNLAFHTALEDIERQLGIAPSLTRHCHVAHRIAPALPELRSLGNAFPDDFERSSTASSTTDDSSAVVCLPQP